MVRKQAFIPPVIDRNSMTLATAGFGASVGIGFANPDGERRAAGEALERFWQQVGPSSDFKIYRLDDGEGHTLRVAADIETVDVVSDTSGLAIHIDRTLAIEAAILEFMERQSLISHWVMGTPSRRINHELILPPRLLSGEVCVREISLFDGVYVVLAIFGSKTGEVKYSVGACADRDLSSACYRALRECEQAHFLMEDNLERMLQGRQLFDNIQTCYVNSNSYETVTLWPKIGDDFVAEGFPVDLDGLLDIIGGISNPPYLALDAVYWDGVKYFICRIFSDCWFSGLLDTRRPCPELPPSIKATRHLEIPVPFG